MRRDEIVFLSYLLTDKKSVFARIITYVMLCGYTPFRSEDPGELYREISACKLTFHERYWKHVSEVAKAFIARLVVADPGERASAEEALGHAWLGLGLERDALVVECECQLPLPTTRVTRSLISSLSLPFMAHHYQSRKYMKFDY